MISGHIQKMERYPPIKSKSCLDTKLHQDGDLFNGPLCESEKGFCLDFSLMCSPCFVRGAVRGSEEQAREEGGLCWSVAMCLRF